MSEENKSLLQVALSFSGCVILYIIGSKALGVLFAILLVVRLVKHFRKFD